MTKPFVVSDAVEIREHMLTFYNSHNYHLGIKHVECLLFNTNGTQVIYRECLEGVGQEMDTERIIELIKHPYSVYHPQQKNVMLTLLTDDSKHEAHFCALVLNPVLDKPMIVGAWVVSFDYQTAILHRERYVNDFNFHYFEQLIHHLQMVLINYEKLYYIIDVYTELLMNKDRYMPYHMTNVANWCMLMASELNLSFREQMVLYISALIHDVGKLYMPDELINRRGKLEDFELLTVRQHPEKSYQMAISSLYGMTFFLEVPSIVRSHHERYDGAGYPDGLIGEEIPFLSRIIGIADTVDAMMSKRPYRDKFSMETIIKELKRGAGGQFDPSLVEIMIRLLVEQSSSAQEETFSTTHFVPQASLNFYYRDIKHQHTVTGNLVMKDGKVKMLVHDGNKLLKKIEPEHVHRCTLSYYQFSDFLEYTVDFQEHSNDQVFLANLKLIPTDKYFSIIWDGHFTVEGANFEPIEVTFVKLGGDSVVFEAPVETAEVIEQNRGEVLRASMALQIEEVVVDLALDIKIIKYYQFSNVTTFVGRYVNISTGDRDRILRMLFKKQMSLKHLKREAANDSRSTV